MTPHHIGWPAKYTATTAAENDPTAGPATQCNNSN